MEKYFIVGLVVILFDVCVGQNNPDVLSSQSYNHLLSGILFNQIKGKITDFRLFQKICDLEEQVEGLKSEIAVLKQGLAPPESPTRTDNPTELGPENNLLGAINVGDVAFYAIMLRDKTVSYGNTVVFDYAMTNDGNAYNASSGVFTCPVSGVYVFSLNIACDPGNYFEVSLQKNQQQPLLESICKNPVYSNTVHQNGGSAVVKLKQGDNLFAQMVWPAKAVTATAKGRGLSTFSGFLLHT